MTKCWTLFSYFLRYLAHFKFDMAPLLVILMGIQLLTIWVQIHPDQTVAYLVKLRSNLSFTGKVIGKYLILMRNDEFWWWSEFLTSFDHQSTQSKFDYQIVF